MSGNSRKNTIVRVAGLPDPQGCNCKDRNCLVLSETKGGEMLLLVAATSSFDPQALAQDEIRLRSGNPQQPSLWGFSKQTVLKCSWVAIVREVDCKHIAGPIPQNLAAAIAENVRKQKEANNLHLVRDDRKPHIP